MFSSIYAGKRVFLTGHTGFKGSWLAEWLLALGAEVHGYALDPEPEAVLFGQLGLAGRLASDTRADLADRGLLIRKVLEIRPDFVFHLAAQPLVRLSYEVPVETFATNVMGTVHVLEALRHLQESTAGEVAGRSSPDHEGAGRTSRTPNHHCAAVMVTTDKCYENREWLHAYREEDAMGGHDPYSASKGAAELAISCYRRSFFCSGSTDHQQVPAISLASARAGNVIGGGDWARDRIVPDCIRALRTGKAIAVRNKTATRPWQHVLEPLSGYLWLAACLGQGNLESRKQKGAIQGKQAGVAPSPFPLSAFHFPLFTSPFNFGPSLRSNRTVAELVQELLKHTGGNWIDASDPDAVHEASKLNLATDKAFHLLQWQPVWDFEDTLAKTAEWYQAEEGGKDIGDVTRLQIDDYCRAAAAKGLAWVMG